jgi:hypothetical protein
MPVEEIFLMYAWKREDYFIPEQDSYQCKNDKIKQGEDCPFAENASFHHDKTAGLPAGETKQSKQTLLFYAYTQV